ncbi:MerR family transcriptional regulator [Kordiimonas marina]|uniref:MerR family transcriptional regulator n=1 Tax=Kordiimonas marina TaxID=2872312 RepID=UPI001FF5C0A3|nr:MerR family transcriptional regulator [Kordiimonas marina]
MPNPAESEGRLRGGKGREAFRTISEVADELDLPQHVLRFWESKFSQIRPLKRGGNRRYYRPDDVQLLMAIKQLLHADGYTIRGVQNLFKAQGLKATIAQALRLEGEEGDVAEAQSVDEQPSSHEMAPQVTEGADEGADTDALRAVLAKLRKIRARLD